MRNKPETMKSSKQVPCRKRMKTSKHDKTKAIMVRPSMPDLVIYRILTLLPTKAALRMSFLSKQWEGIWSLSPVLDFDESAGVRDDDIISDKVVEHMNFINILHRYLEFREKDATTQVLDKFRLHMTKYLLKDSSIIDKWLTFAYERSVKEVDLSLEVGWQKLPKGLEYFYCISPRSFLHAKSLTTLNLEFVRIQDTYGAGVLILPYLKNMSLKSVYLHFQALDGLITGCPSIQCLSLTSCWFRDLKIKISSSRLKSLKVTHCDAHSIKVNEAVNLEHFTFLSELRLKNVTLKKTFSLKYISIRAQYLEKFALLACHDSVEATIHTPGLVDCRFNGFLRSKLYLKDPNLRTCVIRLEDNYNGKSQNFQALRDFLEVFDGTDIMYLYISDFKVITFPEKFRDTYLAPLPKLEQLVLLLPNIPTEEIDIYDLDDSLTWMVQSKSFYWTKQPFT